MMRRLVIRMSPYSTLSFNLTLCSSPSAKTPEELALENISLRASLDALAIHAHDLEQKNRILQHNGEEKEKIMRSMVLGVRREVSWFS